ncbi:hypothetical protein PM082_002079 [Marasmius tenuissimus]|nr:hypothetical protein PM082_002065 [Marasmius tenuissimus]KAJ8077642.1 hypothetical protein PM082_002075 [Marasmius tenuissimus]KAJ8077646.1 hypothetical protein PM082_002079 [Marasmius tenuissimus]
MPGPASGVYYIKNVKTGHFLTLESIDSGKKVWTDKKEPASFQIAENGGVYQISERGTRLTVGVQATGDPRELIWQRPVYMWAIQQVSPGVWNIGDPADDAYWYDGWEQCRWVVLSRGGANDQNNWQLIAAAL